MRPRCGRQGLHARVATTPGSSGSRCSSRTSEGRPIADEEARKPVRLHLGCGTVYLHGYTNIDLYIPGYSFLASERPDLVEENGTTLDRYYRYEETPQSLMDPNRRPRYCVVDRFANILELDNLPDSVDEIVSVEFLEHLSRAEIRMVLGRWYRMLRPGGKLHVDVPDFEETARLLLAQPTEEAKEWHYRLIFGSQKTPWSFHKDGFSYSKLSGFLEEAGFKRLEQLPNDRHFYPAVLVNAYK